VSAAGGLARLWARIEEVKQFLPDQIPFIVLFSTERSETSVMCLEPEQATPRSVHETSDQVLYVVEGQCTLLVGDQEVEAMAGTVALVPAGWEHQVQNTGGERLTVLSVHAPPVG